MTDLFYKPIRELRSEAGENAQAPVGILRAYRDRARALNDRSNAFITIPDECEMAGPIDETAMTGSQPLFGVPYSCKDIFRTRGIRTTAGSRVLRDFVPEDDAAVVAKLKRAGATLVGKTNLHEFCYGITGENPVFGTPANPYDPNRFAAGSSSGSVVSVATGMAAFSVGTDTGGSVRVPAALCGVIGLKPTYGLIDAKGSIPFCWTLDHVGLVTRTCLDAATVLEVLAGWDEGHGRSPGSRLAEAIMKAGASALNGVRIGIPRSHFFQNADREILAATENALSRLRDAGAMLVELETPDMTHVRTASLAIQLVEALSWHGPLMATKAHLYGDDVRRGLVQGQFILAEHYVQSLRYMEGLRKDFAALFRHVDVLVTPTTPIVAPRLGTTVVSLNGQEELIGNALTRYTCVFNLTGNPALTVPCGRHSTGLPIGLQIVGRPYEDVRVVGIGHALEMIGVASFQKPQSVL
jgi:aspartyl-tRNA(Asn)/glutamyl-tRNA(Gln) amidotransferase subunit A